MGARLRGSWSKWEWYPRFAGRSERHCAFSEQAIRQRNVRASADTKLRARPRPSLLRRVVDEEAAEERLGTGEEHEGGHCRGRRGGVGAVRPAQDGALR